MARMVASALVLIGVILLVASGMGGARVGSGAFVIGIVAVVLGVGVRLFAPRRDSPFGNAEVFTPGRRAGGAPAGPTPMAGPTSFQGRKVDATFSAADIVAHGVATTGRLRAASLTGQTAGQVVANVPAEQADDPIARVEFEYPGPSGTTLVKEALVRVPAGKLERLAPGAELPIRFIADTPEIAAIDWSRL